MLKFKYLLEKYFFCQNNSISKKCFETLTRSLVVSNIYRPFIFIVALSNCIDGVTGENAIADLWRDHYESLLNDSTHHDEKADVLQSFNNICSHAGMYVTMSEVLEVVKDWMA